MHALPASIFRTTRAYTMTVPLTCSKDFYSQFNQLKIILVVHILTSSESRWYSLSLITMIAETVFDFCASILGLSPSNFILLLLRNFF